MPTWNAFNPADEDEEALEMIPAHGNQHRLEGGGFAGFDDVVYDPEPEPIEEERLYDDDE
jgi:hypothetical protein